MANRYINFDVLAQKETGVIQYCAGTLGKHHFVVESVSENQIKVTGYATDGSKTGKATVKKDGVLGYNCGNVWSIKPQSEMTEFELLRSEFRLSKGMFNFVSASSIDSIVIEEMRDIISDDNPYANRARFWGFGESWEYEGEHCWFTLYHSFHGGTDQRSRIHRIFIDEDNITKGLRECRKALENRL